MHIYRMSQHQVDKNVSMLEMKYLNLVIHVYIYGMQYSKLDKISTLFFMPLGNVKKSNHFLCRYDN